MLVFSIGFRRPNAADDSGRDQTENPACERNGKEVVEKRMPHVILGDDQYADHPQGGKRIADSMPELAASPWNTLRKSLA